MNWPVYKICLSFSPETEFTIVSNTTIYNNKLKFIFTHPLYYKHIWTKWIVFNKCQTYVFVICNTNLFIITDRQSMFCLNKSKSNEWLLIFFTRNLQNELTFNCANTLFADGAQTNWRFLFHRFWFWIGYIGRVKIHNSTT